MKIKSLKCEKIIEAVFINSKNVNMENDDETDLAKIKKIKVKQIAF